MAAAAVDTHDVTTSVYDDDVGNSASQPRSVVNCSSVFGLSVTQTTAHECHPGSLNDTTSATQPNASVVDALAPVHLDITILDVCLILFLSSLIICVILGNSLVIAAVLLFREMRTLTNALIVSLATADLLVALLVLPISLFFEIADGVWLLGPVVCDFWITTDVFCCTSSILNIVVIALDRYWLITKNVQYTHSTRVPRKRVCIAMTSLAWCTAALIASSPLLGWRAGSEKLDPHLCLISQDYGYTIVSTFGAFWLPLSVILVTYFHIFRFARKRMRRRAKSHFNYTTANSTFYSDTGCQSAAVNGQLASTGDDASRRVDDANTPHEQRTTLIRREPYTTMTPVAVNTEGRELLNDNHETLHKLLANAPSENGRKMTSRADSIGSSVRCGNCTDEYMDFAANDNNKAVGDLELQVSSPSNGNRTILTDSSSQDNSAVMTTQACFKYTIQLPCDNLPYEPQRAVLPIRRIMSHRGTGVADETCQQIAHAQTSYCHHQPPTANGVRFDVQSSTEHEALPNNQQQPAQTKSSIFNISKYLPGRRPVLSRPSANTTTAAATPQTTTLSRRYRQRLRSSARTLGIIIGGFLVCWMPFFILATLTPFCGDCADSIARPVFGVCLWLGYSNSLINPIIYAIWDKKFRSSFKKIIHCNVHRN